MRATTKEELTLTVHTLVTEDCIVFSHSCSGLELLATHIWARSLLC